VRRTPAGVTGSNESTNLGGDDWFVDSFESGHARRFATPVEHFFVSSSCFRVFVVAFVLSPNS
jgi:hypothetical protein